MLLSASRIFFGDLLHRLLGQIQGALPASGPYQKRPKIAAGQEAPFALEYLDGQFVTIVEYGVDLAGQRGEGRPVFVLDPQVQNADRCRSDEDWT